MDINFFDPKYLTEAARDDSSFGLSDDNRMAFTTNDPNLIIAEVSNPANVLVQFIELKDQMANWRQKAISQLESTIQIFSQNHVLEDFRYRVATVANKAHPQFNYSMKEKCQEFREKYKFRLNICAQVEIKK